MLNTLRHRWIALAPPKQYLIWALTLPLSGLVAIAGVFCLDAHLTSVTPGMQALGFTLLILGGLGVALQFVALYYLSIRWPHYYRHPERAPKDSVTARLLP